MNESNSKPPADDVSFAREIVAHLEHAGFQALWAGGCVRDRLLNREPKDYDVATNATPTEVRDVFGKRRTLFIGAAFGVVSVLGPKGVTPVEVATFRRDEGYSDGRRPDRVTFSNAEQDAQRRDFTINGLFFHPLQQEIIDYVGGRDDLHAGLIRCIGDADARFEEDKLRMLRAVRFAATLGFEIEAATLAAIAKRPRDLQQVSAERIAAEMRRLLMHAGSRRGLELLKVSGLLPYVLPQFAETPDKLAWQTCLELVGRRDEPRCLPTALCSISLALTDTQAPDETILQLSKQWKLSNQERDASLWLVKNFAAVQSAQEVAWPDLQPVLIAPGIETLLNFCATANLSEDPRVAGNIQYCREQLQRSDLNPPPLVDGNDLISAGIKPGRHLGKLLVAIRRMQLDGNLASAAAAIAWAEENVE